MKKTFEIVAFYPAKSKKNKNNIGTLHIYDIDLKLDIRGIIVSKTQKGIFFHMPRASAYDEEEKKIVIFPILSFTNLEKMDILKKFLHTEGRTYVFEKLTEIENKAKKTH